MSTEDKGTSVEARLKSAVMGMSPDEYRARRAAAGGTTTGKHLFDQTAQWRPEPKAEPPKPDATKNVRDMTAAEYEAHRAAELRKLGGRGQRFAYLHEPGPRAKGQLR
jgi:hypothetical protein